MTRARSGNGNGAKGARELFLELELRRGGLRTGLQRTLRAAIQDGRLTAGVRLPSSRRLAADLGVSRGVVSEAYDQLVSEGYLAVRPRSAPTVADVPGTSPPDVEKPERPWVYDFTATTPDVSLFPRTAWARALRSTLRTMPDEALDYGDHRGRPELRRALAEYLGRVRGARADPARIVVCQGFTQGLDLLARVLARRGARSVVIESPSLPDTTRILDRAGIAPYGCPVDEHGLVVDRLPRADAAVVTPAHHFPTGAVLTAERRKGLLSWANRHNALIIEDDYDAEFRYDRTGVGALQGLDPATVVHVGTAAKTLAPAVRLGWLTLPGDLIDEVREQKALADSGSPGIDQLAFADLLTTGAYERHVVAARQRYRRRRELLVAALARHGHHVIGAPAGLHVLLPLAPDVDDRQVAALAGSSGIGVQAVSDSVVRPPGRGDHVHGVQPVQPGLVLGFGRIRSERITGAVAALAKLLPPPPSAA